MAYPTVAELRDRVEVLADSDRFPDATLTELVTEFAGIAEEFRGVAFTTRTATEDIWLDDDRFLFVEWPLIQSVTSIDIDLDGTVTSVTDERITFEATIDLRSSYQGMATVVYQHGHTSTPSAITRACRQYVRACALADESNTPRDVISQSFDGGMTRYSTPDMAKGRPTGFLDVDRLLCSLADMRRPGIG